MALSAGDVLLLPFPFRDQAGESTRPAVIVSAQAYNLRGDLVIAAITTHVPRGGLDFALVDWSAAGLKFPSTVRMLLASIADSRVILQVGHLTDRNWQAVRSRVLQVFAWP